MIQKVKNFKKYDENGYEISQKFPHDLYPSKQPLFFTFFNLLNSRNRKYLEIHSKIMAHAPTNIRELEQFFTLDRLKKMVNNNCNCPKGQFSEDFVGQKW